MELVNIVLIVVIVCIAIAIGWTVRDNKHLDKEMQRRRDERYWS